MAIQEPESFQFVKSSAELASKINAKVSDGTNQLRAWRQKGLRLLRNLANAIVDDDNQTSGHAALKTVTELSLLEKSEREAKIRALSLPNALIRATSTLIAFAYKAGCGNDSQGSILPSTLTISIEKAEDLNGELTRTQVKIAGYCAVNTKILGNAVNNTQTQLGPFYDVSYNVDKAKEVIVFSITKKLPVV